MNHIPLQITVISADVLKNVNFFTKMRLYTVVTLLGSDSFSRQITPVDDHGGSIPLWSSTMQFRVEESKLHQNSLTLVFQVRCRRTLGSDKDIGFIYVPVKELFDNVGGQEDFDGHVAYTISSQSGKAKGVLYLSFMFGEAGSSMARVKKVDDEGVSGCALPSAPPCPAPSAPYLPVEGHIAANPTPSAPYMKEDTYF